MENNTNVRITTNDATPQPSSHQSSSTSFPQPSSSPTTSSFSTSVSPSMFGPTGKTVSLEARPIVIPILSSVITFPIVALAVICALRYRAKRARKREHQRRNHQRPCEGSVVVDAPPRIKVTEVPSPSMSVRDNGRSASCVEDDLQECRRLSLQHSASLGGAVIDNQRRISRSSMLAKLGKSGSEDLTTDFPSEAADDFTYAYDILFRKAQL